MAKPKEEVEEMPEGLKLIIKWILLIAGVPSMAYIFLWTSVQIAFENAKTGLQIFLGLGLFSILLGYIYFSIKYLVDETREYFGC